MALHNPDRPVPRTRSPDREFDYTLGGTPAERKNFVENVEELAHAPRIVAHSNTPANVGDNLEKVPLATKPAPKIPPLKTETNRSP